MGLFDLFKKKKTVDDSEEAAPVDKNIVRLGRVVADKHAQTYDRMEAIQTLCGNPSADAAAALLKRFTYYVEPSISDQEEKDAAFQGVLAAKEAAVGPIRNFCARAESLTWPMKLLEQILPSDAYVDELLELLARFDTEYTKNVEPKLQIISALETKKRADVREMVESFLEDVNEPVRFHAATTVFAQEDAAAVLPLCKALISEESVRVKNRICEGLMARTWAIPDEVREDFRRAMPAGFTLDASVVKRAR